MKNEGSLAQTARQEVHQIPSDFTKMRSVFRSTRVEITKRTFKRTLAQLQKEIEVYHLKRYINRNLKREIQRTLRKQYVQ